MSVKFKFDFCKAKASFLYLAGMGLPEFTKGKASKLVFLADKRHLVQHGRPVTGDNYAALEHGPIPSNLLRILDAVEGGKPDTPEAQSMASAIALDRSFAYPRLSAIEEPQVSLLSKSDICALKSIADEFGHLSFTQLRALTHDSPAYRKAWTGRTATAPMKFEDFFEDDPDSRADVFEVMIENNALRESFPDPSWL